MSADGQCSAARRGWCTALNDGANNVRCERALQESANSQRCCGGISESERVY